VNFAFVLPLRSVPAIAYRAAMIGTAIMIIGSIVSSYQTLTYSIGISQFPATLGNQISSIQPSKIKV
jgi:hypothetical protein